MPAELDKSDIATVVPHSGQGQTLTSPPLNRNQILDSRQDELLDKARRAFLQKINQLFTPEVLRDLKLFNTEKITDTRVEVIKGKIISLLGLDKSEISRLSVICKAESKSAFWPGKVLQLTLASSLGEYPIDIPIEIDCGEGIITINGSEIVSGRTASEVKRLREADRTKTLEPISFAKFMDRCEKIEDSPFIGVVAPDNKLLVITSEWGGGSDNPLNLLRCWVGQKDQGSTSTDTPLRPVFLTSTSRNGQGDIILSGSLKGGTPIQVKLDARTGAITLNGNSVLPTPLPSYAGEFDEVRSRTLEQAKLRKIIGEYKRLGVPLVVEHGICSDSAETDPFKFGELIASKIGCRFDQIYSPVLSMRYALAASPALTSPQGLDAVKASTNTISILPFGVTSSLNGKNGTVEIWDYLRGGSVRFTFTSDDIFSVQSAVEKAANEISKRFDSAALAAIVNGIPKSDLTPNTYVELIQDPSYPSNMKEFFQRFPKAKITIFHRPRGVSTDSIDGEIDNPDAEAQPSITLTHESLQTLGDSACKINGEVTSIRILLPVNPNEHKIVYNPKNKKEISTVDGAAPLGVARDRHGNLKSWEHIPEYDSKGKLISLQKAIVIIPASPLPKSAAQKLQSISFGIQSFGNLLGIVHDSYRKVATIQGLFFSTDDPAFTIERPELKEPVHAFARGIRATEEAFGFAAGSKITSVLLQNSSAANAFHFMTAPNGVVIDVSRIDWSVRFGLDARLSAIHETAHTLDDQSKWLLSGGGFDSTFKLIKHDEHMSRFLDEINEDRFFGKISNAGHAADNPQELLASTIASLFMPEEEWKLRVSEHSKSFRAAYGRVLQALQTNLEGLTMQKWLPDNSEIAKTVDARLKILRGH